MDRLEALLFGGWKGEVWVEPGKEPSQVRHQGARRSDCFSAV